jgi:hypothetical protein
MMMKAAVVGLLALPAPAFAAFDCIVFQRCTGLGCEQYEGSILVEQTGEMWTVSGPWETHEGYETMLDQVDGVSIVLPAQGGISGLLSIYPKGDLVLTIHESPNPVPFVTSVHALCEERDG